MHVVYRLAALYTGLTIASYAPHAAAIVISEDELEETSFELGAVVRSFAFLLAGDVLAPPYAPLDYSPTGMHLLDLRLYASYRSSAYKLVAHDSWTTQMRSAKLGMPFDLGRGATPARWLPLFSSINDDESLSLRRDTDWLYAAFYLDTLTVSVGRQPITFGRGRLWTTQDLVTPFALTEVDKDYKPGADSIRLDWSWSAKSNLSVVAAVGELESHSHDFEASLEGSSFIARFSTGWPSAEVGLLAGLVRMDAVLSADAMLATEHFDVYSELSVTQRTASSLASPGVADPHVPLVKAVLGATGSPSPNWTVIPELYFNAFGAARAADYLPVALSSRVAIGEQPGWGRLYAGLSQDVELHPLWHVFTTQIVNLADPSALLLLGLSHDLAANVKLYTGAYYPMGHRPQPGVIPLPQSEFGSYPTFIFAELKGVI